MAAFARNLAMWVAEPFAVFIVHKSSNRFLKAVTAFSSVGPEKKTQFSELDSLAGRDGCAVPIRLWKSKTRKKVIPSAFLNHSKCLPYGLPLGSMLLDVGSSPSLYPHSVLKVFSLLVISQYVYLSSRLHLFFGRAGL